MIEEQDRLFLAQCREVAAASDCVNRKVGAIVVWRENVLGRGHNHNPIARGPSCASACPRGGLPPGQRSGDYDLCIYVHAEAKAIIDAGGLALFATLYCTDDPCPGCWKLIHAAGISRVVTPNMESNAQVFPQG